MSGTMRKIKTASQSHGFFCTIFFVIIFLCCSLIHFFPVFQLFSICLKICTCVIPTANFNLDESEIAKFPWMVTITNKSFFISYGSLIHKKAVLTRAILKPDPKNIENLRVYADCFFLGINTHISNYNCSKVRQVDEYNIIEEYQDDDKKNLAIVILTESFRLSERVNIIKLAKHESDFHFINCGVISLMTVKNPKSNISEARFFSMFMLTMANRIPIIQYPYFSTFNGIINYNIQSKLFKIENFVGSPLVCASLLSTQRVYILIGVVDIVLNKVFHLYRFDGDIIRTDGENVHVQEIFKKIIKVSFLPKKNVRINFDASKKKKFI